MLNPQYQRDLRYFFDKYDLYNNVKYIIVGRQCSGKHETLNILQDVYNVHVAREFRTLPDDPGPGTYIDHRSVYYDFPSVEKMFEAESLLCISSEEGGAFFRGTTFYDVDNNDVLSLYPEGVINFNKNLNFDGITWVWMDCNLSQRRRRFIHEKRKYNFDEVESLESQYDADLASYIYDYPNSAVIYFNNEVPERVACIINACIQHPDLLDKFIRSFN